MIAEDFRAAGKRLGITSSLAASRCGIDSSLYIAFEEGSVDRNQDNLGIAASVAKRLGLEEIRISYVEDVQQQYLKLDLYADGPLTIFIDTLRHDVRELEEHSLFVNPHQVFEIVERIGFDELFRSREHADKRLAELWIASVFALSLGQTEDYYVGLIGDNAPDVEVIVVGGQIGRIASIKLEITQHGRHSAGLTDVIEKKLSKKYAEGTVIVVLVEQAEDVRIEELDDFIRANNAFSQEIVIIGGSRTPGSFKLVPWERVTRSSDGEISWMEIDVRAKDASKGYRGYDGIVFKSGANRLLPLHPVFVKDLDLRR